jgi:hypothetical protein
MHELDNVYVADGSVFVSSGGFNPTVTIMALALRAARALSGGQPTLPPASTPARTRGGGTGRGALPATGVADGTAVIAGGVATTAALGAASLRRALNHPGGSSSSQQAQHPG